VSLSTVKAPEDNGSPVQAGRGSKQSDLRAHNERLVLSLLRRRSGLTKAEIARVTGLSAQAVSVIIRRLEDDGLLERGKLVRGRIGQPSTPMTLKADGAFSIGVKIGRRSLEMVLIDFVGRVRSVLQKAHPWPMPEPTLSFIREGVEQLTETLSAEERNRIAGLGIASPFELWLWEDDVGAPPGAMQDWRTTDLVKALDHEFPFPVYLQNDATAACGAEFVFGQGQTFKTYLYLFIGFFIGGGLVINGSLFSGSTGSAGAIGPFPITRANGAKSQLLDVASTFSLEARIRAAGLDPTPLWTQADDWNLFPRFVDGWIDEIAPYLAEAIIGACSIIDFPAVIIDGGFPATIRQKIVDKTQIELDRSNTNGIVQPLICAGTVGAQARSIGGACLPFFDKFILSSSQFNFDQASIAV
jgi:predicted NBD/HSP70 family sugar kinase